MNNSNHQVVDIRAMDVGYFSVKLSLGRKTFDGNGDIAPYSSQRKDRFGPGAVTGDCLLPSPSLVRLRQGKFTVTE